MPQHQPADAVVVGGGVIGLAIAWRAAQAGWPSRSRTRLGRGASWAAAGMLAPVTEVHYGERPLLDLNLAAATGWPGFATEVEEASGPPGRLHPVGTLAVARDADDNAALEDLYQFPARCARRWSACAAGSAGSWSRACTRASAGRPAAGDHQVDNRALVEALLVAGERAGVRMVAGRVAELAAEGDRVTGVVLGDGERLAAAAVVLAAGCWSGGLEVAARRCRRCGRSRGSCCTCVGRPPSRCAPGNVRGLEVVYVAPRGDGRVVVGATVEEQGFDTRLPPAPSVTCCGRRWSCCPTWPSWSCWRPCVACGRGRPDNAPMIGPAGPEGLVVATGHYRNGILLAPVTGHPGRAAGHRPGPRGHRPLRAGAVRRRGACRVGRRRS